VPDHILASGDSPDLEALFDSIASQNAAENTAASVEAASATAGAAARLPGDKELYQQIGLITRRVHDALRDMSDSKSLDRVASVMPDARDRLGYIASLTQNAAERVLNAVDIAQPLQDALGKASSGLAERWNLLHENQLPTADFGALAEETRAYLEQVPTWTRDTNKQLLEIILAQDFQDLTGQVVKKMMEMFKTLENEMLTLLVEFSPDAGKAVLDDGLLNGPVVNPDGRSDVVTNQQQVDDLLERLGF